MITTYKGTFISKNTIVANLNSITDRNIVIPSNIYIDPIVNCMSLLVLLLIVNSEHKLAQLYSFIRILSRPKIVCWDLTNSLETF
jgi:hypothetical protein